MKTKTQNTKITQSKAGFTIIELMIAMTFVALLLIAIAVVTINIVSIYQKGLSIKAVNNVGRSLIEEMTTTVNSAPAVDTTSLCNHLAVNAFGSNSIGYNNTEKCKEDNAYKYVFNDRFDADQRQYSGVFCTGNYSYLWNTQLGLQNSTRTLTLKYKEDGGSVKTIPATPAEGPPRFIRILDRTYRVCTAFLEAQAPDPSSNGNWELDITKEAKTDTANAIPEPTSGYLKAFDLDLMLYELTIQKISQDAITLRTYMTGNFILATDRGGIDITASGDYCQNTFIDEHGRVGLATNNLGNLGAEFNYCAINKFNFAARTAGV